MLLSHWTVDAGFLALLATDCIEIRAQKHIDRATRTKENEKEPAGRKSSFIVPAYSRWQKFFRKVTEKSRDNAVLVTLATPTAPILCNTERKFDH